MFGKGLYEASLKCTRNFFKNSSRGNIRHKHLRPEVQDTLSRRILRFSASPIDLLHS